MVLFQINFTYKNAIVQNMCDMLIQMNPAMAKGQKIMQEMVSLKD